MPIRTVAILSPGDMGHAVGRALRENAVRVITCLEGRSKRTRELATRAGIENVFNLGDLVTQSDLVLSIIPPAEAMGLARQVAEAIHSTGSQTLFADCNAISPQTSQQIGDLITAAGGRFIDASIIGFPPGANTPRFYASGPYSSYLAELDGMGFHVRLLGDVVGKASGIKMCYAAMTKGTSALYLALLTVAELLGLSEDLYRELEESQSETYRRMRSRLPALPAKAHRWVGEMEEIAATFQQAGVTPYFHLGAAEIYRLMGLIPMAEDTPEGMDTTRTLEQTIAVLAGLAREHSELSTGGTPSVPATP